MSALAGTIVHIGLVGCKGVGKTTILQCLRGDSGGAPPASATMDCAQLQRTVPPYGRVNMYLWDTPGMDAGGPETLARQFWRRLHAVVIVYDLTARATFDNVPQWVAAARANAASDTVPVFVMGNKADLAATQRTVTQDEGSACCAALNSAFAEISALQRDTLEEMAALVIQMAIKQHATPVPSPLGSAIAAGAKAGPPSAGTVSLANTQRSGWEACSC